MAKGMLAEFVVRVVSQGLGRTKADVDGLSKSAQQAGMASIMASKASGDLYKTQAKGVIGTANSTKSFSKLAETIQGGGSGGIVGAYATLAANVFAVTAAFNALKGAAGVEQITRGLEVLGARSGQALGDVAKGLREVTGFAISTEQALRSTAQITSAGFNGETVSRLGKVAADASLALGRDMTDSLDRLSRGVVKLEPELLDELGLMTRLGEASSAYALQLGKPVSSLTTLEKRQGFLNAVLAEGELKFGGVSDSAGELKNYDKLAATFADLTKNVLDFVNKLAGLGIAGFLADNMTALMGTSILFLSTLKSQLLPGLQSAAQKAAKIASEAKSEALTQQNDILQGNPDTNPRSVEALVKKGASATANDYSDALKANNIEVQRAVAQQDRLAVSSRNSAAVMEASAAKVSNLKEVNKELVEALYATDVANTKVAESNTITAASTGKPVTAIRELAAATRSYGIQTRTATVQTGALGAAIVATRTITYGAVLAFRALGAALLAAIPYIGIAVVAFGALSALYDNFIKSDATKQKEKNLKEILELTATTAEKEKALLRIDESKASIASVVEQRIVLQSNALTELASKYKEVSEEAARAAAAQEDAAAAIAPARIAGLAETWLKELRAVVIDGAGNAATNREALVAANSRQSRVSQDSEILQQFNEKLTKDGAGAVAVLDSMNRIAPEITNSVLDMYGGMENLGNLSLESVQEAIAEIGKRAEGAAELVKELTIGLKELEAAYVAYIAQASAKTPFDGLVTASQKSIASINQLQLLTAKGVDVAENWAMLLTSIGDRTRNSLSGSTLEDLKEFETAVIALRELEQTPVAARTSTYAAELEAAKALVDSQKGVLQIVEQELAAQNEVLAVLQRQDIVLQGQISIGQARLQISSRDNALTAEGVEMQLRGQNNIKQLEIARLEISKVILANEIAANNRLLERIEYLTDINGITQEAYRTQLLIQISDIETERRARTTNQERRDHLGRVSVLLQAEVGKLDSALSLREGIASAEAAILNLTNQQAVLQENMLTNAEIEADVRKKALETAIEAYNVAEATRAAEFQTALTISKIANLRNGTAGSLAEQLSILRATTTEQKRIRDVQNQIAIANLTAQRMQANARRSAGEANVATDQFYANQIIALQAQQTAIDAQTTSAAELAEVELLIFDTRKEGLEYQKSSLEYIERSLEAQGELTNLQLQGAAIQREIERRQAGNVQTSFAREADELRSQEAAHRLLIEGLELRKSMIDLEFALLDAERVQLISELETRAQMANISDEARNQLELTIGRLENQNIEAIRLMARAAEDQAAANSALALRRDAIREGTRDTVGNVLQQLAELRGARRSALSAAEIRPQRTIETILPEVMERSVTTPVVNATSANTEALVKLTDAITALSAPLPTGVSGNFATPASALEEVIRIARENGVNAHESPTTGGVTPRQRDAGGRLVRGHAGAAHYEGRAVDLYSRPGTGESTDPAERAKYDRLAATFREMGATVLWQVRGHFDHMHVEFARDFSRFAEAAAAIQEAGMEIPATIQAAVVDSARAGAVAAVTAISSSSANDNEARVDDIVVTGQRRQTKAEMPKTDLGINTLQEFGEAWDVVYARVFSNLEELGPEGRALVIVQAGLSQLAQTLESTFSVLSDPKASFGDKFQAGASAVLSALSTIQGALAATSEAKIAGIDREIAAEQKRDGKSAESVAKLAALEKKKEAAAKKAFEVNKKLMMAQAVISTAAAIAGTLASTSVLGPFVAGAMAALIGAMGAAQLAIIAGTSYQSSAASVSQPSTPAALTIGKRGDSVDLARNNANAGGEIGYLRGARGQGNNASNYNVIGSAYGGQLPRGYGKTAFAVGEHGPEIITPETPITVRPMSSNDNNSSMPQSVNFNINALDASGVEDILRGQRGNIIGMLREAANASGQSFLEDVNVSVYTKPNVGKL